MFGDVNMFIAAYWSARKESGANAAARITRLLLNIRQHKHFSEWLDPSREIAISIDAATIESKFKRNRTDVGRKLIPELGYYMTLWNGESGAHDVLFSAHMGSHSPTDSNSIIFEFDSAPDFTQEVCHAILQEMIREFDPDSAVVTSHSYLAQAGANAPHEAGWFTYERDPASGA